MAITIYHLLGGMTVAVSAVLYLVIKRTFLQPHMTTKSRRLRVMAKNRKSKAPIILFINSIVAMVTKFYHHLGLMAAAAFAMLYSVTTKAFYIPDETPSPSPLNKPKSRKSKTRPSFSTRMTPREPTASPRESGSRASSPVSGSSSGSSTVVGHPPRTQSIAAEDSTAPVRPQQIKLQELSTLLDSASSENSTTLTLSESITRLKAYMSADLHIDPGASRLASLLHLIYTLHFTIAPARSLPFPDPEHNRSISARELACVFLNRYGHILWPTEPEPAPHLNDRELQFPRDAEIPKERYWEWHVLGVKPPVRGSAGDLAMSLLGQRMSNFVKLVYELPLERKAEADWGVVALVLDDVGVGRDGAWRRQSEWSGALRRAVTE